MKQKALIVDDDIHISELIALYLAKEGFETKELANGNDVVEENFRFAPDIILLDVMLPGTDGFSVLSGIRKDSDVPVVMLTAKGESFDKVLGLTLGADDYIVKPFDPKEMVARVKAVLRRYDAAKKTGKTQKKELSFPGLEISLSNYSVICDGELIDFPPRELELLFFLAKNPGRVFTRDEILDSIWGYEYAGDTRTVDVHIKRIREKLPKSPYWRIGTVRSVGYKFEVNENAR